MSTNTVRKEVAKPEASSGSTGPQGLSVADEFEAFFAEQFRPAAKSAPAPVAAPAPAAAAAAPFNDPLMAELARIVGQGGAPAPASQRTQAAPPQPAEPADPLKAFEDELRRFDEMHRAAAQRAEAPVVQPLHADTPVAANPAPQFDPVAALEEELRRYESANPAETQPAQELRGLAPEPAAAPVYPAPEMVADPFASEYQQPVPDLDVPAPVAAAEPKSRSRKVVVLLSAAAAIAVVGVVGAVTMKSGKRPLGGEPPVIAAKGQPMKEKPADPGGAEIPGQDRQVLARGSSEPTSPANVVNKEEQPVDLNQTPKRDVARVVLPAPNGGAATSAPQASAPIIMPPSGSGAAQPQEPAAGPNGGGFEAKRVRSVKVGAEGGTVPSSPPPAAQPQVPSMAAAPTPSVAAPKPVAATPPAAPKVETRTATATPKSDARPSTAARAPQTTTPQPTRQTAARPAAPTAADDDEDETEAKPLSLRPPSGASPTRQVARTTAPATTASTSGGGFAVQLGAPPSEEEARRMASSMRQRHASALGGASPSVRAATVGEKTVYRVRVGGLSRDRANEMCSAIKSNGGSCFVAGN